MSNKSLLIQALMGLDICVFFSIWLYTFSYFLEHMHSVKHLIIALLSFAFMFITTYYLDRIETKWRGKNET